MQDPLSAERELEQPGPGAPAPPLADEEAQYQEFQEFQAAAPEDPPAAPPAPLGLESGALSPAASTVNDAIQAAAAYELHDGQQGEARGTVCGTTPGLWCQSRTM